MPDFWEVYWTVRRVRRDWGFRDTAWKTMSEVLKAWNRKGGW